MGVASRLARCAVAIAVFVLCATGSGGAAPGSKAELESFIDALFTEEMARRRIPGAGFALVRGGEVVLLRGYGRAELERGLAVDPAETIFRVGSVSKLVTTAAVLQLAERGLVDLTADLRRYVPQAFVPPVTAEHLLTHTAGLDDRYIGIAARRRKELLRLSDYLALRMPPRVRPAGELMAYSNHGFALLGLLVENVSGKEFAAYVEENVFRPLGMERSAFAPPVPSSPAATGYRLAEGEYEAVPFDYFQVSPASSLRTTAEDMSRFLLDQLSASRGEGSVILGRKWIEAMQRRRFAHHPALAGRAYGYHERRENGERALAHAGGLRGFGSFFLILPERDIGFFVAYNRYEEGFHEALVEKIFDRFFPPANEIRRAGGESPGGAPGSLSRLSGAYRPLRFSSERSFEKLMMLFSEYRVRVEDEGLILVEPDPDAEPRRFVPGRDLVFRSRAGDDKLAFRTGPSGEVTHMFIGAEAYRKLHWYEEARLHRRLFGAFTLVFQSAVFLWPLSLGLSFLRSRPRGRAPAPGAEVAAWVVAFVVCAANVAFLVGLGKAAAEIDPYEYLYGMPESISRLLHIPEVSAPLALLGLLLAASVWRRSPASRWAKLHLALVTMAALGFIVFLDYWNLLGHRY